MNSNDVKCDKCGGYLPGHATGASDICQCEPITTPISGIEMEEYLFAKTAVDYALRVGPKDVEQAVKHIRETLRLHRFLIFGWLLHNGVKLPVPLVADQTHLAPGMQWPDQPWKASPTAEDTSPRPFPQSGEAEGGQPNGS